MGQHTRGHVVGTLPPLSRIGITFVISSGPMHRALVRTSLALLVGVCTAVAACGGAAPGGAEGAECFRASECAAGLVCIALSTGQRVCTSDVSSVDFHEDAAAADGSAVMMPAGEGGGGGPGEGEGGGGGARRGGAAAVARAGPAAAEAGWLAAAWLAMRPRGRATPTTLPRTDSCYSRQKNFHGLCLRSRASSW